MESKEIISVELDSTRRPNSFSMCMDRLDRADEIELIYHGRDASGSHNVWPGVRRNVEELEPNSDDPACRYFLLAQRRVQRSK